jgi:hypothetical protein
MDTAEELEGSLEFPKWLQMALNFATFLDELFRYVDEQWRAHLCVGGITHDVEKLSARRDGFSAGYRSQLEKEVVGRASGRRFNGVVESLSQIVWEPITEARDDLAGLVPNGVSDLPDIHIAAPSRLNDTEAGQPDRLALKGRQIPDLLAALTIAELNEGLLRVPRYAVVGVGVTGPGQVQVNQDEPG